MLQIVISYSNVSSSRYVISKCILQIVSISKWQFSIEIPLPNVSFQWFNNMEMQVLDDFIVSICKFNKLFHIQMKFFNGISTTKCKFWWSYPFQMKVCDGDFFFIVLFLQGWMKKGDKNQVTGKDLNRFKSFLATTNTFLNYE